MSYSIPKGVFDLFPTTGKVEDEWKLTHHWQHLYEEMRSLSKKYGFEEIVTPIFEKTELFARSIGQETDVVSKEMYTFQDKGKRSLTLRPEGTASVIRTLVERKLYNEMYCHKLFYLGPMFRYERPQAGRYRQFYQFGAEVIGLDSPEQDVELIDLLFTLFQNLGLHNLTVYINSIGNAQCRKNYREALVQFLTPQKNKLSEESQRRLEINPLRILDSKNKEDQKIIANAPTILDFLEEDSKLHFEAVQSLLRIFKIPFKVNTQLVRGLDYYNRTVFEIACGDLGAQDTVAAGGRYDSLVKTLGGPDLPAVGFALGIERLLQIMLAQKCSFKPRPVPLILLIPLGELAKEVCFKLLKQLRVHDISAEMDFSSKKLKHIMKYADKKGFPYISIIGEEELQNEQIKLKHMTTGKEQVILLDQLVLTLINQIQNGI
ncbi:MAG: Histidine--tRNA ligase [Chlamydiae bacterium]|nr:Histidine--tRNA ligase [Chlamydiota bacterium]